MRKKTGSIALVAPSHFLDQKLNTYNSEGYHKSRMWADLQYLQSDVEGKQLVVWQIDHHSLQKIHESNHWQTHPSTQN